MKIGKNSEARLRALLDKTLAETLPAVDYDRVRQELQDAIVVAVKQWLNPTRRKQQSQVVVANPGR